MSFLLDTNIISEIYKRDRCHPGVAHWYASTRVDELHLSVLVVGEIRKGIERARPRDAIRANALEAWLVALKEAFGDRIVPIDGPIAEEWGRMAARRPVPTVDALLAATAIVHGMILVTRNIADVAGLGADILNPFTAR